MSIRLPIDTHVHALFDELSYGWMSQAQRMHLVRELGGYDPARVAGVVLIEGGVDSGGELVEARAVRALADGRPWVRGFVAPLAAAGPALQEVLGELLLGYRLTATAETGPRLAVDDGLPIDILCREDGWSAVLELVARNPEKTFVLDHCARPVDQAHHALWEEFLAAAARHPRVVVKLSGGRGDANDRGVIEHSLSIFGADRALVGSDWPISSGSASSSVEAIVALLGASSKERDHVLTGTAQRVYGGRHIG